MVGDDRGRAAALQHLRQDAVGQPARGAVQRPLQRAEPGRDDGVGVRPGGRGDPGGERGGGQVVVDEQRECRVQQAN